MCSALSTNVLHYFQYALHCDYEKAQHPEIIQVFRRRNFASGGDGCSAWRTKGRYTCRTGCPERQDDDQSRHNRMDREERLRANCELHSGSLRAVICATRVDAHAVERLAFGKDCEEVCLWACQKAKKAQAQITPIPAISPAPMLPQGHGHVCPA